MKVEFTPQQDALRKELREYFAAMMTPELKAECDANFGTVSERERSAYVQVWP